jgi:heme-degrading monooxygenase HmoA
VPYRRVKDPKEAVVIFKLFLREDADLEDYGRTSARMHELVEKLPGFLSLKEYRSEDGEVLDIARFRDETSLETWRREPEHLEAQRKGREEFYDHYAIQALKVVRDYEFWRDGGERRDRPPRRPRR